MPDNEGDIFKYTQAAKSTDALANLQDEVNGEANDAVRILTYNDLSQSGTTWSASAEIKAENNTEHKFILTIPAVKDILGRPALGGQTTEYSKTFSIDKKNPKLSVVWNPANPVGNSGNYYNQVRTASLNIEEMNFNSSKIKIHQTFIDDYGNKSETDLNNLNWNTSGFNHLASFSADKEGDYTFSFEGEDEAAHELIGDTGDVSFTTDWTAPSLNISFDNDSVVNGKYFTAARTAMITIGEHNFDGNLIKVNPIVTPGNDGTIGSASFSG